MDGAPDVAANSLSVQVLLELVLNEPRPRDDEALDQRPVHVTQHSLQDLRVRERRSFPGIQCSK